LPQISNADSVETLEEVVANPVTSSAERRKDGADATSGTVGGKASSAPALTAESAPRAVGAIAGRNAAALGPAILVAVFDARESR
jgi:hypothetical protein